MRPARHAAPLQRRGPSPVPVVNSGRGPHARARMGSPSAAPIAVPTARPNAAITPAAMEAAGARSFAAQLAASSAKTLVAIGSAAPISTVVKVEYATRKPTRANATPRATALAASTDAVLHVAPKVNRNVAVKAVAPVAVSMESSVAPPVTFIAKAPAAIGNAAPAMSVRRGIPATRNLIPVNASPCHAMALAALMDAVDHAPAPMTNAASPTARAGTPVPYLLAPSIATLLGVVSVIKRPRDRDPRVGTFPASSNVTTTIWIAQWDPSAPGLFASSLADWP